MRVEKIKNKKERIRILETKERGVSDGDGEWQWWGLSREREGKVGGCHRQPIQSTTEIR